VNYVHALLLLMATCRAVYKLPFSGKACYETTFWCSRVEPLAPPGYALDDFAKNLEDFYLQG